MSKAQVLLEELKDPKEGLKELLLSHGGDSVLIRNDEDIEKILKNGKLFTKVNKALSKKMRGKTNQCHYNASHCWDANRDKTQLATGFYLTDNIWREHSWVVYNNKVIETTDNVAAKYFGYIMSQEDAEDFLWDNE